MTDVPIDAGTAAYRGFLFSDMRGFTAFAERHGNTAAASLVGRFLDITRKAIARHQGAEIKTEGDAIHAVFPSASSAVLCGLEIADAAADLSSQEPEHPLRVGVGVHAGEAVETAEGYIGTAVNLAARVCSAARPGEVLVTSTVKSITQASIPVGFIARGRRRLKGIREPVEVFAVTRDLTARPPRAVPRQLVLAVAGVAVVALAAAVVVAGSMLLSAPGASPSPPASSQTAPAMPSAQPVVIGPLGIGTYRSQAFEPPFTFVIRDRDWTANRDEPGILGLLHEASPLGSVYFLRIDQVFTSPCTQGGEGSQTGPAAADVIDALEKLDAYLTVSDRQPASVGDATGEQVDVTVADGALAACGGLAGADVSLFGIGEEVWGATPGERFRLVVVDVGDAHVTMVLSSDWTQIPSVQEQEKLLEAGEGILASVRF